MDGLEHVGGYMLAKLLHRNVNVDFYRELKKKNMKKTKWTASVDEGYGHYTYPNAFFFKKN